ncbi:MAG: hypothetical protein BMS9Abin02_1777 [Anaerolineae bacterium]|nr:MAG: hypothetical protein BMS9Abin02_1777 [Anaerolineae bacterium]
MDTQQLSAIRLIAGLTVMVAAFLIGLQGIYKTPDLQRRV